MNKKFMLYFIGVLLIFMMSDVYPQASEVNYDEAKVPQYSLPDPLIMLNRKKVKDAKTWETKRRSEILKLFEENVYGKAPGKPTRMRYKVNAIEPNALAGKATRKEIIIHLVEPKDSLTLNLLIYLPNDRSRPLPTFVGLNFLGNQTIIDDLNIPITKSWVRNNEELGISENRATEASRGVSAQRWQVQQIIERGYALGTVYYGDIDPDFDDGFKNGVHVLYDKPKSNDWGSIAAWAWGLSRVMDYLETDNDIDHNRVIVMGHSRLGKTALWAGAVDPRFSMVISNNSGCGGAAISRRQFGETVKIINTNFPHWFCENFKKYNDKVNELPVDQHMLIALIAPRPIYITSAEEDRWADPKGEFFSAVNADPVYRLLGTDGLSSKQMPELNQPIMSTIGYHIRPGKHDVTEYDWQRFMDFADIHLRK